MAFSQVTRTQHESWDGSRISGGVCVCGGGGGFKHIWVRVSLSKFSKISLYENYIIWSQRGGGGGGGMDRTT